MATSVHALRERYIKAKLGLPQSEKVLDNVSASNLRHEVEDVDPEDEKPKPWAPSQYYTSVKDFNEDLPNILESLKDDYGKENNIEYGSKKAILGVRKLFQNVAELYIEKTINE